MPYEVQTAVFEGPFDLLLHLILREQVDLYEVSLSTIVDAYLSEVERLDAPRPRGRHRVPADRGHPHRAEVAAPAARRDRPRARRRAGPVVRARPPAGPPARVQDLQGRRPGARPPGRRRRPLPAPGHGRRRPLLSTWCPTCSRASVPTTSAEAFLRASAPRPIPRIDLDHVAPIRASVTDAVEELLDELPRVGRIGFRELTASLVERLDVVVRFLAILELFKQGAVDLLQARTFGDIEIVWLGVGEADDAPFLASLTSSIDVYEG